MTMPSPAHLSESSVATAAMPRWFPPLSPSMKMRVNPWALRLTAMSRSTAW